MKRPRYKWTLLAFLFVGYFVAQGSRQMYNAALPQIKVDFAATDLQLGMVGTVFAAVFGLSLMASGIVADMLGRARVLMLGTALFSLGIFASGFAGGPVWMIASYGVLNALGQCCVAPASLALISRHHRETRSVAMAVFQGAVYSGVILGSLFAGGLAGMGEGLWRWAFWGVGGFGLAWALVLKRFVRDAEDVPPSGAEGKVSVREAFLALWRKPTAVMVALAFSFFIYATLGIRMWTPMFMVRSFGGIGTAAAALHAVLWLNAGAFVSCLVTARVIDRVGVRHPRVRLISSAVGFLLAAAPILLVARAGSVAECCVALTLLGVATGICEAAHYPAMFDCIEPRYHAAAAGLTGALAFVFGSAAPALLGWMNDRLSMRASIASLAVFYLAGAATLLPAIFRYFRKDYVRQ